MSHHTPTRRRHVFSAYHFSSLGIFNGFVTSLPSLMQQPSECVCVASPRCFLPAWIIHHSPLIILFFFLLLFLNIPLLSFCLTHPVCLSAVWIPLLPVSQHTLFIYSFSLLLLLLYFYPSWCGDFTEAQKKSCSELRRLTGSISLSRRAEGQTISAAGGVNPATGFFKLLFVCYRVIKLSNTGVGLVATSFYVGSMHCLVLLVFAIHQYYILTYYQRGK